MKSSIKIYRFQFIIYLLYIILIPHIYTTNTIVPINITICPVCFDKNEIDTLKNEIEVLPSNLLKEYLIYISHVNNTSIYDNNMWYSGIDLLSPITQSNFIEFS